MYIDIVLGPQRQEEMERVHAALRQYNRECVPALTAIPADLAFAVFARDTQGIVRGGLQASASWNWMHIELLWVASERRRGGIGRRLVLAAEDFAREKGFHYARVETASFQARPFYEKLGYTVFGILEDSPLPGYADYFMKKKLD